LVRSLTSAQRLEVAEAEEAIDTATFALEHARASVNRDRQERHALQMRVVLAARYPDPMLGDIGTPSVPVEHESRRGMNTIEMMPLFELERASQAESSSQNLELFRLYFGAVCALQVFCGPRCQ
jgi:hypothetical protein